jgi:hypothetical protein
VGQPNRLSAVGSQLAAAGDDTRVWLHFVALNRCARGVDVDQLKAELRCAAAASTWPSSTCTAKRACCVLEWDRTLAIRGYVCTLCGRERVQLLSGINVSKVGCSTDKAAIMEKVVTKGPSAPDL